MFNRVLVVEDRLEHFTFLEQALEAHNAGLQLEFVQSIAKAKDKVCADFDLYILDLELPDGEGVELIPDIRKVSPDAKIMINTVFEEDEMFFKAMRLGIDGYVLKTASQKSLISSINDVFNGMAALSPVLARKLMNFHAQESAVSLESLTEKERVVLKLIAQGHTMKSAAEEINRSIDTVKYHVKEIYKKTGVQNRSNLLKVAHEMGVV